MDTRTPAPLAPLLTWLSLHDAAEALGVSERTMRRRINDGTVRATRFGPRLIRVDATSLTALASIGVKP
jgi:excisionase family DNA binding protein